MTILKLTNSFYAVATQLGLAYKCGTASDVELNIINTQGALVGNPNGQTGTLFPKLNFIYPDAQITDYQDNRITYNCMLLFTDLINTDNQGRPITDTHTETLSNLQDKALQFLDIVEKQLVPFLTATGNLGDYISISNAKLETLTYATSAVTAQVRVTFDVATYYECNTIEFDPSLLDLDTPYPVTGDYDYEDTNNK